MSDFDVNELGCTGGSATWCPNCGDCTCPLEEWARHEYQRDCPIHGDRADHGERRQAVLALGTDE